MKTETITLSKEEIDLLKESISLKFIQKEESISDTRRTRNILSNLLIKIQRMKSE